MTDGAMILANGGTALVTGVLWLLLILNPLIASIEASTVHRFAGGSWRRLWVVLVIANYSSSFLGVWLLSAVGQPLARIMIGQPPVTGFVAYSAAIIGVLVMLTLIVECGLVLATIRFLRSSLMPTLLWTLLANLLTNAAIALFLAWLSVAKSPPGLTVVEAAELARDQQALLYWIASDNAVYARKLVGGEAVRMGAADSRGPHQWLSLTADPADNGVWLTQGWARRTGEAGREVVKLDQVELPAAFALRFEEYDQDHTIDLQPVTAPSLRVRNWWRSDFGTTIHDVDGRIRARFAVEIPGYSQLSWTHVLLPDGQVVLTLGDSICLYDIETNRIALLAKGRGPVVVPSAWRVE